VTPSSGLQRLDELADIRNVTPADFQRLFNTVKHDLRMAVVSFPQPRNIAPGDQRVAVNADKTPGNFWSARK
jgi:hypothetical protein